MNVSISPETYAKLERMIKGSGFRTVDEYAEFVLKEVASEGESPPAGTAAGEDEEKIKGRLRALGYLD